MATKITDTITLSGGTLVTGPADPGIAKWPEIGGTVTIYAPGATDADPTVVELRAWNNSSAKEVLATFTLPVPASDANGEANSNAGALFDSLPVFSTWDDFDYNVVDVGTATSIVGSITGVGV